MLERILRKNWLSPLVGIFFVAVGLSGTLMLFHLRFGGLKSMHEWIGLAFVVAAALHVLLNWRTLICYCKTRAAILSITVGFLLCGLFMLGGSGHDERRGPPPGASGAQQSTPAADHDE